MSTISNQAIISKAVTYTVKFVGKPTKATIDALTKAGLSYNGQSRQWYSRVENAGVLNEDEVVAALNGNTAAA